MPPTLWIIAEHAYNKHPFLWATATYCFDTEEDAKGFYADLGHDQERTMCYYMPMPVWCD